MADGIGFWARRIRLTSSQPLGVPMTKWHLVESEIADRIVTRCGRELKHRRDEPFEFNTSAPGEACYWCGSR